MDVNRTGSAQKVSDFCFNFNILNVPTQLLTAVINI